MNNCYSGSYSIVRRKELISNMMNFKNMAVLSVLCLSLAGLSACSRSDNQTTGEAPVDKPVVGSEQTEEYAEKPVSVENSDTDPYTGTRDEKNYVGKHPIAEDQTAAEKMGEGQDSKSQH